MVLLYIEKNPAQKQNFPWNVKKKKFALQMILRGIRPDGFCSNLCVQSSGPLVRVVKLLFPLCVLRFLKVELLSSSWFLSKHTDVNFWIVCMSWSTLSPFIRTWIRAFLTIRDGGAQGSGVCVHPAHHTHSTRWVHSSLTNIETYNLIHLKCHQTSPNCFLA